VREGGRGGFVRSVEGGGRLAFGEAWEIFSRRRRRGRRGWTTIKGREGREDLFGGLKSWLWEEGVVVEEGVDLDEGGREGVRERAGSTWVGRRE